MRIYSGITTRLSALVGLSFIGFVVVTALILGTLRDTLVADGKAKTRGIVEAAYSLVAYCA